MPHDTIHYRFLTRGGTASALTSRNEIPLDRELVFETDTGKAKLGDGLTRWDDLRYVINNEGAGQIAPVVLLEADSYVLDDLTVGAWHIFTSANPVTLHIGASALEDSEYGFEAKGAGGVTLVEDSGVTVWMPKDGSLELEPGDFAVLKRTGIDEYKLVGSTRGSGVDGIPEAPIDGRLYGRKDGAWESVPNGGGSDTAIVITLDGDTYTLADFTNGAWHEFTSDALVTITVVDDAVQTVPNNAEFGLMAAGSSGVIIVADNAAVIVPPKGGTLTLAQDGFAVLKRRGADSYKLLGETEDAP